MDVLDIHAGDVRIHVSYRLPDQVTDNFPAAGGAADNFPAVTGQADNDPAAGNGTDDDQTTGSTRPAATR